MATANPPVPTLNPIRVLLIEDERAVALTLQRTLQQAGMVVEWVASGAAAHASKATFRPHVALVDLHLPDSSGFDLITWLATDGDCGVIVVTGAFSEADRVVGLELGADDFIVKPPAPRELVARVRAVYRRMRAAIAAAQNSRQNDNHDAMIETGPFRINLDSRTVIKQDGGVIHLTSAEFMVIETLAKARSQPVTRDRLSERALRRAWQAEDRAIDQIIFGLRQKLPRDRFGSSLIQSVRGLGYVLRCESAANAA